MVTELHIGLDKATGSPSNGRKALRTAERAPMSVGVLAPQRVPAADNGGGRAGLQSANTRYFTRRHGRIT